MTAKGECITLGCHAHLKDYITVGEQYEVIGLQPGQNKKNYMVILKKTKNRPGNPGKQKEGEND